MGKVHCSRLGTLLLLAAVTTVAPSALAQDPAALARARERFREAAALQAAGDWARALDGYKEVALVKSSATLRFNIATCEEKTGDYLRALGSYRFALTEATKTNAKDMEGAVKAALEALEPRIPTLLLKRGKGAAVAEVTLDGRPLGNPSVGVAFQVNPGPHEVRATAPGRQELVVTVELADRDKREVELVLKPVPVVVPVVTGPVVSPDVPPDAPPPPKGSRSLRNAGFVVGGLGVGTLIASAVLYSQRQKAITTLDGECGPSRMGCPASAKSTHDSLLTYNSASIGTLAGGAVALAIGGTLLIVSTRSKAPAAEPRVGLTILPGGGAFVGSF